MVNYNFLYVYVLPHWPAQTWWSIIKSMLVEQMWAVKPAKDNMLLTQPTNGLHHLYKKSSLVICLFSGDIMKGRVFNKTLYMF